MCFVCFFRILCFGNRLIRTIVRVVGTLQFGTYPGNAKQQTKSAAKFSTSNVSGLERSELDSMTRNLIHKFGVKTNCFESVRSFSISQSVWERLDVWRLDVLQSTLRFLKTLRTETFLKVSLFFQNLSCTTCESQASGESGLATRSWSSSFA